ncbi:MAG TPA: hypothetical protein VIF36_02765 [Gaiellaceae bacterium]
MVLDTERSRRTSRPEIVARLTTETKHAFKTTEFWGMIALVAGILIASWVVGDGSGGEDANDAFPAVRAWLYVAIVGAAYMVSRGLAKAGSREPYWADRGDLPGGRENGS